MEARWHQGFRLCPLPRCDLEDEEGVEEDYLNRAAFRGSGCSVQASSCASASSRRSGLACHCGEGKTSPHKLLDVKASSLPDVVADHWCQWFSIQEELSG